MKRKSNMNRRYGYEIDPDIAEVMAWNISRHRNNSVPRLTNGQLTFGKKEDIGEAPTEFAGFDILRRDDIRLIETCRRRAVERKTKNGESYISYVTTYWIRSKCRPVIEKPTVLAGSRREIPEWGVDQSALLQLLAYRYWKRSYVDRMNRMRKSIQTFWLSPPETGIPLNSRKALDRFRGEGNELLVRCQDGWRLDENAFNERWRKAEQSGDVSEDDRHLMSQSAVFPELWNSDWGLVSWNDFWSIAVRVDESEELLCTLAELRWSRETPDPEIRHTMLLHPLLYPAFALQSQKSSS